MPTMAGMTFEEIETHIVLQVEARLAHDRMATDPASAAARRCLIIDEEADWLMALVDDPNLHDDIRSIQTRLIGLALVTSAAR
jgi:hypothetical protein